jgi:hypothetical protein
MLLKKEKKNKRDTPCTSNRPYIWGAVTWTKLWTHGVKKHSLILLHGIGAGNRTSRHRWVGLQVETKLESNWLAWKLVRYAFLPNIAHLHEFHELGIRVHQCICSQWKLIMAHCGNTDFLSVAAFTNTTVLVAERTWSLWCLHVVLLQLCPAGCIHPHYFIMVVWRGRQHGSADASSQCYWKREWSTRRWTKILYTGCCTATLGRILNIQKGWCWLYSGGVHIFWEPRGLCYDILTYCSNFICRSSIELAIV